MSMQLIPVFAGNIQNQAVQLVDARLLHTFLESAQDFSDWIKNRIKDYGFIENQDYLRHKFMAQVPHQGGFRSQEIIDYHLTLDMGKELSMVERNNKGKQARKYFIECERLLKQFCGYSSSGANQKITAINKAFNMIPGAIKVAQNLGMTQTEAIIAANKTVKEATGIDVMTLFEQTQTDIQARIKENP